MNNHNQALLDRYRTIQELAMQQKGLLLKIADMEAADDGLRRNRLAAEEQCDLAINDDLRGLPASLDTAQTLLANAERQLKLTERKIKAGKELVGKIEWDIMQARAAAKRELAMQTDEIYDRLKKTIHGDKALRKTLVDLYLSVSVHITDQGINPDRHGQVRWDGILAEIFPAPAPEDVLAREQEFRITYGIPLFADVAL